MAGWRVGPSILLAVALVGSLLRGVDMACNKSGAKETAADAGPFQAALPKSCIDVGGQARCWWTYVPDVLVGGDGGAATTMPLVVDLHGFTAPVKKEMANSGWRDLATVNHFVVAWPDGLNFGWNAGECCGLSSEQVEGRTPIILIMFISSHPLKNT